MKRWFAAPAVLMTAMATQARAQPLAADVIYHHGKILTVNERFDVVQALAVRDGQIHGAGEVVDMRTAIRLHTLEPAYLTFDEKTRGSLEIGKAADMVVLGQDPLSINPDRIREIPVEQTIVAGREIYSAARTSSASPGISTGQGERARRPEEDR